MHRRYLTNSNYFDKHGDYIPGTKLSRSLSKIKTNDPAAEDRENRNQVVEDIEKLINSGITIEEACKNLVEKHKDKFKYFSEESLAGIFANWYNGKVKAKGRLAEGRTW